MKVEFLKADFNAMAIIVAAIRTPFLALKLRNEIDAFWHRDEAAYPIHAEEPLTKSEIAFVESIFGKEINTARVRKYFSSKSHPDMVAGSLGPDKIKFFGSQLQEADHSVYSWVFIHEMTHIWQNQRGLMRKTYHTQRHSTQDYKYTLLPQSRFKDFGTEQQASIIADYAMTFLSSGKRLVEEDIALLQKTVEARFPQARKTRLACEAQRRSPRQKARL